MKTWSVVSRVVSALMLWAGMGAWLACDGGGDAATIDAAAQHYAECIGSADEAPAVKTALEEVVASACAKATSARCGAFRRCLFECLANTPCETWTQPDAGDVEELVPLHYCTDDRGPGPKCEALLE